MNKRSGELFSAIDRKDADGFVAFLTEDAAFRFANAPVIHNKKAIHDGVSLFFTSIKKSQHRIGDIWEQEGVIICEGEVVYTRHDGSELALPFADILRMQGDLISDYRIYMDISALSG